MTRPASHLNLDLVHAGVATWCRLLNHQCDGVAGTCSCVCHDLNRPPG